MAEVWGASHHAWRLVRGIDEEGDKRQLAEGVAALAEAQHGVASAAQLYALGLSKDQVEGRVRAGWLHRVHRGVYALGREQLALEGRLMAAVLAVSGAVVSHRSATALWGIRGEAPASTEVTISASSGRPRRQGLVIHRVTTLHVDEVSCRLGIRVTTPARTLLDVSPTLRPRALERAVDEAERLGYCRAPELLAMVARHRGHRGAGALGRVLEGHVIGSTVTRSELEERFLRLCKDHRLPKPILNAQLHGLTVDFLWEPARLVAEVDGQGSHRTRRAFQDDRDRDSLLAAQGYQTLRFTWFDVTRRPAVVAHRLRRVFAGRT